MALQIADNEKGAITETFSRIDVPQQDDCSTYLDVCEEENIFVNDGTSICDRITKLDDVK